MAKKTTKLDSVRASRDGHEYHEAWVARKSMGLLLAEDDFVGIAIEGFSAGDQSSAGEAGNEIADAVLYYGQAATFHEASKIVVVQVKYSKASEDKPFRAADAKKTIGKFAATYRSHTRKHGVRATRDKLRLELLTNRPILPELLEAISQTPSGNTLKGVEKHQADQIKNAAKLKDKDLVEFIKLLNIVSLRGDLQASKKRLARAIADWSPAIDAMTRIRLGHIRELARDKANLAHQHRNVISRIDVLNALELQDEHALLPCPASFPIVEDIVERKPLADTSEKILHLDRPLVIHAEGGVGKTTFMNSLARALGDKHETILFDCFGMGQYRAYGDARHLPGRGLLHIVNELACRGLCDPLLPGSGNSDDIIRAFRARIVQACNSIRMIGRDRKLILLIDAIDNASEIARDRGDIPFPRILLENLEYCGAIDGFKLVVSSRTHRRADAIGTCACEEIELEPFSIEETRAFLKARIPEIDDAAVQVAQSRSQGNARILAHLIKDGSMSLLPSEINRVVQLDDLIRKRIQSALVEARKQGYKETDISAFLSGLASLPPPVPISEFAEANGLSAGAVNSFASDLYPLLEQTKHGLMFRDEPTETVIRDDYANDHKLLMALASNLRKMQGKSVYAAVTLPELLIRLDDGDAIFNLAFEEEVPAAVTSIVGQRSIRLSRLRAAVSYYAHRKNYDRLVPLLTEMSTLAASDQRASDYVLHNPDLAVASEDTDAIRRLFETRTAWPGRRHARLSISHALLGDTSDACWHAVRLEEWTRHHFEQDEEVRRECQPEVLDIAAMPFCKIAQGDCAAAIEDLTYWRDWYAFEVTEAVLSLCRVGMRLGKIPHESVQAFLSSPNLPAAPLIAAIAFAEQDRTLQKNLISRLAAEFAEGKKLDLGDSQMRHRRRPLLDELLFVGAQAIAMEMKEEAAAILSVIDIPAPSLHSFTSGYWLDEVLPFLATQALRSTATGDVIRARQVLPDEIHKLAADVSEDADDADFVRSLKSEIKKRSEGHKALVESQDRISYEQKSHIERFLDYQLPSWLIALKAFSNALSPIPGSFRQLLDSWRNQGKSKSFYISENASLQMQSAYVRFLIWTLRAASDHDEAAAVDFLTAIRKGTLPAIASTIEIIATIAARPKLQVEAGALALRAKAAIEVMPDVEQRADLLAALSRAILPASRHEAAQYFRTGLDQLDAIGSGDHRFVNELLTFAASLNGEELSDQASHTLSNICELNLDDDRKFPWALYGEAMAKASGLRGISKLARWEDRSVASLDYTLLPYLKALLDCKKISPEVALTMLRVSAPAELYVCGTSELIESIERANPSNLPALTTELIEQYLRNNPSGFGSSQLFSLEKLARKALGDDASQCIYLSSLASKTKDTTDEYNDLKNWRPQSIKSSSHNLRSEEAAISRSIAAIARRVTSVDEISLHRALEEVDRLTSWRRFHRELLAQIREGAPFESWPTYLTLIASHIGLTLHDKLHELIQCKLNWEKSSNAIKEALTGCVDILIREHAVDLISFESLFESDINDLSTLSSSSPLDISVRLIGAYSHNEAMIPASVWIGLAAKMNSFASRDVGKKALERLLTSGAAKIASTVADGPWRQEYALDAEQHDVAASLIWFSLGSPRGSRRWMAAHSLRSAVSLGVPELLDKVVARYEIPSAGAFQAPDLKFHSLHAQLWLLIALARIAQDHPAVSARHSPMLEKIAFSTNDKHVLKIHFATQSLLTCIRAGLYKPSRAVSASLKRANKSPFPVSTSNSYRSLSSRGAKSLTSDTQDGKVHLDYDFEKNQVSSLSAIFGLNPSDAAKAISDWVRLHDSGIVYMSDSGGRSGRPRNSGRGLSSTYHSYGEHLCWHALHSVAGDFLSTHQTIRRPYYTSDPWDDWLEGELLTRADGLWLSDGIDWRPTNSRMNLCEGSDDGLAITSSRRKLLLLANIDEAIGEFLTIAGDWRSVDGIGVHIQSALVPTSLGRSKARALSKLEPFEAYLPHLNEYEDGPSREHDDDDGLIPWVLTPSREARLDEADILGAIGAVQRSRLTGPICQALGLASDDPFGRSWHDASGSILVRTESWLQHVDRDEDGRSSGTRTQGRSSLLRSLLSERRLNLLLLIVLRRYQQGFGSTSSKYWHTTAVIRIDEKLGFTFYPGCKNALHDY